MIEKTPVNLKVAGLLNERIIELREIE